MRSVAGGSGWFLFTRTVSIANRLWASLCRGLFCFRFLHWRLAFRWAICTCCARLGGVLLFIATTGACASNTDCRRCTFLLSSRCHNTGFFKPHQMRYRPAHAHASPVVWKLRYGKPRYGRWRCAHGRLRAQNANAGAHAHSCATPVVKPHELSGDCAHPCVTPATTAAEM